MVSTPRIEALNRRAICIKRASPAACVDAKRITFEIIENVAMADPDRSLGTLRELSALGVRLSLDDFGTGLSSLCRPQQFPFDSLKIDRSFISSIAEDTEAREIVRIVLMLAHNLGMTAVAEGVEAPVQMSILQDMGCEFAQGYLFSRPAHPEAIEALHPTCE
jgi:EAL domain-containing protein (putative c-di-GMP-specific phosphodiesterase class I)